MTSRDAKTLLRASKILDRFASTKSKYSQQWLDELGEGLEEVARAIDPTVRSLVVEEE